MYGPIRFNLPLRWAEGKTQDKSKNTNKKGTKRFKIWRYIKCTQQQNNKMYNIASLYTSIFSESIFSEQESSKL